jgi:hypothetical protein
MVEKRLKLALRLKLDQLENDIAHAFAWPGQARALRRAQSAWADA